VPRNAAYAEPGYEPGHPFEFKADTAEIKALWVRYLGRSAHRGPPVEGATALPDAKVADGSVAFLRPTITQSEAPPLTPVGKAGEAKGEEGEGGADYADGGSAGSGDGPLLVTFTTAPFYFSLSPQVGNVGARVKAVKPESEAMTAGVKPGYLVLEVDGSSAVDMPYDDVLDMVRKAGQRVKERGGSVAIEFIAP